MSNTPTSKEQELLASLQKNLRSIQELLSRRPLKVDDVEAAALDAVNIWDLTTQLADLPYNDDGSVKEDWK
jgi:hypothetical protein